MNRLNDKQKAHQRFIKQIKRFLRKEKEKYRTPEQRRKIQALWEKILYGKLQSLRPENVLESQFDLLKSTNPDVFLDSDTLDTPIWGYDGRTYPSRSRHHHLGEQPGLSEEDISGDIATHLNAFKQQMDSNGVDTVSGEYHHVLYRMGPFRNPVILKGAYLYRQGSAQYIYNAETEHLFPLDSMEIKTISSNGYARSIDDDNGYSDSDSKRIVNELRVMSRGSRERGASHEITEILLPKYQSSTIRNLLLNKETKGVVYPHGALTSKVSFPFMKNVSTDTDPRLMTIKDQDLQSTTLAQVDSFKLGYSKEIETAISLSLRNIDSYTYSLPAREDATDYADQARALIEAFKRKEIKAYSGLYERRGSSQLTEWDYISPGMIFVKSNARSSDLDGIFINLESHYIFPVPRDIIKRARYFSDNQLFKYMFMKNMNHEYKEDLALPVLSHDEKVNCTKPSELARDINILSYNPGVGQYMMARYLKKIIAGHVALDMEEINTINRMIFKNGTLSPIDTLDIFIEKGWRSESKYIDEVGRYQSEIWEKFLREDIDRQMVSDAELRTLQFVDRYQALISILVAVVTLPLSVAMGPAGGFALGIATGVCLDLAMNIAKAVSHDDPEQIREGFEKAAQDLAIGLALEVGGELVGEALPQIVKVMKKAGKLFKASKTLDDISMDTTSIARTLRDIPVPAGVHRQQGVLSSLPSELQTEAYWELQKTRTDFYRALTPATDKNNAIRQLRRAERSVIRKWKKAGELNGTLSVEPSLFRFGNDDYLGKVENGQFLVSRDNGTSWREGDSVLEAVWRQEHSGTLGKRLESGQSGSKDSEIGGGGSRPTEGTASNGRPQKDRAFQLAGKNLRGRKRGEVFEVSLDGGKTWSRGSKLQQLAWTLQNAGGRPMANWGSARPPLGVEGNPSVPGTTGRPLYGEAVPVRRPALNNGVWEGQVGVLPGSDQDFIRFVDSGGDPDDFLKTLKEAEPQKRGNPFRFFSSQRRGKVEDGQFLVSNDDGASWKRGTWLEESVWRFKSRKGPADNVAELDSRINKASKKDSSYSRICYTGAYNDAQQAATISPDLAAWLHRKVAKPDRRGEIMDSQHYRQVFGLTPDIRPSQTRFGDIDMKQSGFMHIGERRPDGSFYYDHVVYTHVNGDGVYLYQVNGSDFQLALGEGDRIGKNVSASHTKHHMNAEKVAAFNRYFSDNSEAGFVFTPASEVNDRFAAAANIRRGDNGDYLVRIGRSTEEIAVQKNSVVLGRVTLDREVVDGAEKLRGYTDSFKGQSGNQALSIHGDQEGFLYHKGLGSSHDEYLR
ncbi:hypothetical protein ACN3E9_19765 [Vibrio pectenicida]|uniref:hypothetical protein n=1 Tax=Vibrio pectenicida TaxID=62763 RepID=UPI003B9AB3A4